MKRGKPLKRTPLKRGNSQLKRTPLNARSEKMQDKYVARRELVKEVLNSNPFCEACKLFYVYDCYSSGERAGVVKQNYTRDLHELVNRSQGGSILDKANIVAVCRPCHNRITTDPKVAERIGLHLESWCYTPDGLSEAMRVRDSWALGVPTFPSWMDLG